eukprot:1403994-Karenia_brevis.AAC.1
MGDRGYIPLHASSGDVEQLRQQLQQEQGRVLELTAQTQVQERTITEVKKNSTYMMLDKEQQKNVAL